MSMNHAAHVVASSLTSGYGGKSAVVTAAQGSTLPFTGIDLTVVVVLALLILLAGLGARWATKGGAR